MQFAIPITTKREMNYKAPIFFIAAHAILFSVF